MRPGHDYPDPADKIEDEMENSKTAHPLKLKIERVENGFLIHEFSPNRMEYGKTWVARTIPQLSALVEKLARTAEPGEASFLKGEGVNHG